MNASLPAGLTLSVTTSLVSFVNSATSKRVITKMDVDAFDNAVMEEAIRDFEAGLGAPARQVLDKVRRQRRERAALGKATPTPA